MIASLALALASTACESPEPTGCGHHDHNGNVRFCAADGSQVCICQTERCAEHVETAVCPSTLRYVYDGECVPASEVLPNLDPSNTAMMCEDSSGPTMDEPVAFGGGLSPHLLPFADGVLLEATNAQGPETPEFARDWKLFRLVGWDLSDLSASVHFDPGSDSFVEVSGAQEFAACSDPGDPRGALFGYRRYAGGAPLLVSVIWNGTILSVEDVTTAFFGVPPAPTVRTFRIVRSGNACFVAWTTDATDGPMPPQIHVARFVSGGMPEVSASLVAQPDDWAFHAMSGVGPDAVDSSEELFAIPDGNGGIIAAVAVADGIGRRTGILGGRWSSTLEQTWHEATNGSLLLSIENTVGIEGFYRNVAAVSGSFVVFSVVAVTDGTMERCLYYSQSPLATGGGALPSTAVPGSCGTARLPSLLRLPDASVFVGYSSLWGGGFTGPGQVNLFGATSAGTPMEPPIVALQTDNEVLPLLSEDGNGNILVLWMQFGANFSILLDRYTIGRTPFPGWPEQGLLVKDTSRPFTGENDIPQMRGALAVPGEEAALVGWSQDDGSGSVIYVRRIDWGTP